MSTYWGANFRDVIPAIWVETGRRINFTNPSGITPEVDDWVYLSGSKDPAGLIVEVQSTYLVVKYLIGSFADADTVSVRKVTDNKGPDFQETWTATCDGADVKETGVYMEFANVSADESAGLSFMPVKWGGFCFDNVAFGTSVVLGGASGGWKPPSGCDGS